MGEVLSGESEGEFPAGLTAVMVYCLLVAVAPQWIFRSSTSVETGVATPTQTTAREASLVFAEP